MGVFTRIFKVAQASAHAGIEALDDPIKITEQGIRDMKNLQGAMSSLAQVKALAVVPGPLPVAVALALQALRARSRVASSMRKINRQLASGADASGTVAMLEKMKHKVQEEESLAEAYDSLVDVGGTIDDDINRALAAPSSSAGADALAELRAKMGGAKPARSERGSTMGTTPETAARAGAWDDDGPAAPPPRSNMPRCCAGATMFAPSGSTTTGSRFAMAATSGCSG